VNSNVAGGWGIGVERMRVGSSVVDTSKYYVSKMRHPLRIWLTNEGSLDPGFDAIYVPTSLAEQFYSSVPEAIRDATDRTRWVGAAFRLRLCAGLTRQSLPCEVNISMTVTISGHEYNVASSELVQPRDRASRTCWGSLVAWENASLPEELGEIRLGTPFLSGVYA